MTDLGKYAPLLHDLNLNPADFPHGTIEQFVDNLVNEFHFQPPSIRPLLQSQILIQTAYAAHSFRIAVTGAIELETANSFNAHSQAIETLITVNSMHGAVQIAADLRKYYLRHYPGRCHRNTGESNFTTFKPTVAHVYIAFFDKLQHPPRDTF